MAVETTLIPLLMTFILLVYLQYTTYDVREITTKEWLINTAIAVTTVIAMWLWYIFVHEPLGV